MKEMKKTLSILSVIAIVLSCNVQIVEKQDFGTISIHIDNAPVVEVTTKADAVSADNFNVYISSENDSYTYVYKDIPGVLSVPVGMYTVKAENVTEEASLTQPDEWGQVRYAGSSATKEVKVGAMTDFSFTCSIVNAAVSVVFDSSIADYFTDYTVTAYATEDRQLVYNQTNTSSETPIVGYFMPGTITYIFSGTFMDEAAPRTIYGTKNIQAATHEHLTFKIAEQDGSLGINIAVDSTCEHFYETITVDPTDDSFITE